MQAAHCNYCACRISLLLGLDGTLKHFGWLTFKLVFKILFITLTVYVLPSTLRIIAMSNLTVLNYCVALLVGVAQESPSCFFSVAMQLHHSWYRTTDHKRKKNLTDKKKLLTSQSCHFLMEQWPCGALQSWGTPDWEICKSTHRS